MRIAFHPPLSTPTPAAPQTPSTSTEAGEQSSAPTAHSATEVYLSPEARKKAEAAKQRDADIDASHLSDSVKESLKAIRELKQKLEEKVKELAQLASDNALSADRKESRGKQLQIEVNALHSALTSAEAALNNSMSAQGMSVDDRKLAHALIGAA
ncbi:hypothetical protein ACIQSO_04255 [Pseudomonas putida]|uniref:hypothetical protein n=1 Tax=Pseudomonas putida TaxID=303 RepID=UPI00383B8610